MKIRYTKLSLHQNDDDSNQTSCHLLVQNCMWHFFNKAIGWKCDRLLLVPLAWQLQEKLRKICIRVSIPILIVVLGRDIDSWMLRNFCTSSVSYRKMALLKYTVCQITDFCFGCYLQKRNHLRTVLFWDSALFKDCTVYFLKRLCDFQNKLLIVENIEYQNMLIVYES